MGVNPEDPAAMASIQRVASTFFNAIDKKEGSPYVFREGKQSITEAADGLEESEPSVDSDQEELDQFIAEIEDAADKEYEAEEAKEKEELGIIRYRNREEFGGRFRRSDASRNDDYDGDDRSSRVWPTTHPKHRANYSNDEGNSHSDNDDDEWHSSNIADASDLDSGSDGSNEARGRFKESRVEREKQGNIGIGRALDNKSSKKHTEAKFKRNMAVEDSESEGMFSDIDNAMWESGEEENDTVHSRQVSDNYRSGSSDDDDEYAYQIKRDKRNGGMNHEGKIEDSVEYPSRIAAQKNGKYLRGMQEGISKTGSKTQDVFSDSENWMWHSDAEEEDSRVSRADRYNGSDTGDEGDYPTSQNSNNDAKTDVHKRRTPKEADEAWDSD